MLYFIVHQRGGPLKCPISLSLTLFTGQKKNIKKNPELLLLNYMYAYLHVSWEHLNGRLIRFIQDIYSR